jgi:hypothetical protein
MTDHLASLCTFGFTYRVRRLADRIAASLELAAELGFRIVGTVPDSFRLPDGSTVSQRVMYRALA